MKNRVKDLRKRKQIKFSKGLTRQEFREECQIDNIIEKYTKTGVLDHVNRYEAQYGEATSHDYKSALDLIISSQDMFDDLPAQVRAEFNNDPAAFLDFVSDPENVDKFEEVGLVKRALKSAQTAPEEPETPPEVATEATSD